MKTDFVRDLYKKKYNEHGRDGKSLFTLKNRNKERFDSLGRILDCYGKEFSILDYGCGLGDLKKYLDTKNYKFKYIGVDIVQEMIRDNNELNNSTCFQHINSYKEIQESFDYISIFAVFNCLYNKDPKVHKEEVFNTLHHLLNKTKIALCVNFMTDEVDYIQEHGYHQNLNEFLQWAKENMSTRFIVDNSYLPYEYSVILFKDTTRNSISKSDYNHQYT